ncbi:MAG TPA: hypothetical protein VJ596_10755, partial [Gemmatimonadaceae bacterium]|nr:hypothetical protein [Gemmatimonadaceae bacterium]
MRLTRTSIPALLLIALAACSDLSTDVDQVKYGVITVVAETAVGGSGFVTSPVGLFYTAGPGPLPDSKSTADVCRIDPYSTALPPQANVQNINAGPSITFRKGSTVQSMAPVPQGGVTNYVLTSSVPFVPGEQVTFEIPGAEGGFPSSAATTVTAPTLTVDPVNGAPPAGTPLTITWDQAGDDSSRVEIALRYATQNSAVLNELIYCQFRDDGQQTINDELLNGWRNSNDDLREVAANRFR